MRERRIHDGQVVLFDARDVLDTKANKGKTLLKIINCGGSFITNEGTRFWQKHPFQWVTKEEAQELLGYTGRPTFVEANIAEVEDWYAY